jgi:GTP cyclohydrolase I
MDKPRIERLIKELLEAIGEDTSRDGLAKTPERVARSWEFLTSGYDSNLDEIINGAIFESESNNMIISRDIEVYSLCEHHLLPFYGRCHIGYVADKHVLGLSKLARIVDHFARRLQIQERLTSQIAQEIMDITQADGVGVVIECRHLCSMMRGVEKQNSVMTTSTVLGSFRKDSDTRSEFMKLISRSV